MGRIYGQEAAILDRRQPTKLCDHIPGNAPSDRAAQRATQAMCARAAQRSYSRVSHDRCGLLKVSASKISASKIGVMCRCLAKVSPSREIG